MPCKNKTCLHFDDCLDIGVNFSRFALSDLSTDMEKRDLDVSHLLKNLEGDDTCAITKLR